MAPFFGFWCRCWAAARLPLRPWGRQFCGWQRIALEDV
jgi:hypothetical protein